ncbi:rRNA maturation RNase YbeY [Roseivirga spongicola]|uniref:Endoribonuclease YbeY n=1 Tax=Roseivirga spongicola TaxID=333140 RepID=A0A150XH26_9BACT|nr:rRNA maturation RNase YbeY [Roseivirga spongicola]KYG78001.1 rRNA maturation factor [Roseivirga spongicola]WPZ11733.1 rRNA maturation RNase YbeY [Roseivirga spongicola]
MSSQINFFVEDVEFKLNHKTIIRKWIKSIVESHQQSIEEINYIFCSDEYLLNVNREYLYHDYYTDIITFDNREALDEPILSDIFISIDRVKENAITEATHFDNELYRVLIHGVLHLLGQADKTEEQQVAMRKSEEASLSLLQIPKK